jgi:hypothetical protein
MALSFFIFCPFTIVFSLSWLHLILYFLLLSHLRLRIDFKIFLIS